MERCCSWDWEPALDQHIVDGIVEPMELGHLPYKHGTYESYVGNQALVKNTRRSGAATLRMSSSD